MSTTALPLLVLALTGTLAILGASICVLALGFSQVRALRAASLAPTCVQAPEQLLPISDRLD